jgi:hypothetical protein
MTPPKKPPKTRCSSYRCVRGQYEVAVVISPSLLGCVSAPPATAQYGRTSGERSNLEGPACLQERNVKHPDGGPEASRLTATARRKLGTLGSLVDGLRSSLEAPQYAGL